MIYVLATFAIGLAYAAWRTGPGGTRVFLIVMALANAGTAVKVAHDGYRYAWKLAPHHTAPGIEETAVP